MPKYKLMAHQREAVKFLDDMNGVGALLMDPGVGKTGSTLAWIDRQASIHGEFRVLVIAPLAASDTWVLQPPMFMDSPTKARMLQGRTTDILPKIAAARSWTGVPDAPISVDHVGTKKAQVSGNRVTILSMSAGSISSWNRDDPKRKDKNGRTIGSGMNKRQRIVKMLQAIRKYDPHLIVLDESHIAKSATGNLSIALYQIGQLAPHRIILTGTVNPHSPLDVYGQWRFFAPWTFSDSHGKKYTTTPHKMTKENWADVRPWPWGRFKGRYTESGGYQGKEIKGFINLSDLNARVAERSFVVLKEDALDLPPTTPVDVHVVLSARERRAYDEMRKDLAAQMADGSLLEAPNALAKIMKLRQITAGFVKDTETEQVHQLGSSKRQAVADIVNTTLVGENRVVVFAYFKSECTALAEALKQRGRTVELVTGATKASERLAIRQRFGDTTKHPETIVLVAQMRTMSLSVNELVTAQNAVFASISERREDWVQSHDRLDRNGQTKPVTFWHVHVPDTIDQVMMENHERRGDMEKALLDHIRAVIR